MWPVTSEYLIVILLLSRVLSTDHMCICKIHFLFRYTCSNGQQVLADKWKKLADYLNALGGSYKDHEQWKKFWADLK